VIEIQCASRDISERMQALEREREHELQLFQTAKLASLGTLVSGIAHEINNPNNFIRLNSQNLQEFWKDIRSILDSSARTDSALRLKGIPYGEARGIVEDLLGGIGSGSARIEKLLLNLRDFARGDEGGLDEMVGLNEVVISGVMIVQNLIQSSTDCFSVRASPSLPPVRGNYHQLEQVVINLVTNACQAIPSRDKKIAIETRMEDGEKWVALVVADEGIGIAPDDLPRVVDPFFTTKRQRGGSGLGLAVSSRIIQNHGGSMSFNSEIGKGTVATVRMPAAGRPS
jgi:signal transduction histidine kinase